ncbi:reverse transcriptase domain-containing protein [Tanacetum coccineum]|uniref:Reverse transcriptase domain-containing protein n=1 Tax=Tanacetum coccineum TaxID=301880 RepID=A0ABQ4Y6K2_9ASTR
MILEIKLKSKKRKSDLRKLYVLMLKEQGNLTVERREDEVDSNGRVGEVDEGSEWGAVWVCRDRGGGMSNHRGFGVWNSDHGGNSSQNKEHKVIKAHVVGPSNKKVYAGKLPHCNKCKLHYNGPCTAKCENCKEVGHLAKDCRGTTVAANQKALKANQRTIPCFKCGKQGHYRSECPVLKNQNRGNQAGSSEARGRVCALGGGEADQDPNNIADNVNA